MNSLATFFRESGPARFLLPVGLSLIIFGIVVFVASLNNQNYLEVQATVTNVVVEQSTDTEQLDTYSLSIKYKVDNKEYENELSGMSKHKVGDKIKIYYDPSNPNNITQTKSIFLPIILIGLGIASLIAGIVSAKKALEKNKIFVRLRYYV